MCYITLKNPEREEIKSYILSKIVPQRFTDKGSKDNFLKVLRIFIR